MGEISNISWCDSTVNDIIGCTKVGPGCAHCYAEALDNRGLFGKQSHWGPGAPRLRSKTSAALRAKLNRKPCICETCGKAWSICAMAGALGKCPACGISNIHPRRIFSLSLGDWLEPEIPSEWLAGMMDSIRLADQCTHILCTKRPENFFDRIHDAMTAQHNGHGQDDLVNWLFDWWEGDKIPPNIWLLTSVENQEAANKRIPELLKIPAAVHGISAEPLLGLIDVPGLKYEGVFAELLKPLDWVIVGGESGCNARPCNVEWIRSINDQCKAASVPVYIKQLGSNIHGDPRDGFTCDYPAPEFFRVRLRHPKGGDPAEWPADLRVREFPRINQ